MSGGYERTKRYYKKNTERVHAWSRRSAAKPERRLRIALAHKIRNFRFKREVLSHYGNACACCGEDDFRFLCVDHIMGGGSRDVGGMDLYRRLKKLDYPEGFQVLCYNCNFAKGEFTACPHQFGHEPIASLLYQYETAWVCGIVGKRRATDSRTKRRKEPELVR